MWICFPGFCNSDEDYCPKSWIPKLRKLSSADAALEGSCLSTDQLKQSSVECANSRLMNDNNEQRDDIETKDNIKQEGNIEQEDNIDANK